VFQRQAPSQDIACQGSNCLLFNKSTTPTHVLCYPQFGCGKKVLQPRYRVISVDAVFPSAIGFEPMGHTESRMALRPAVS
jgi:hypothetical protein